MQENIRGTTLGSWHGETWPARQSLEHETHQGVSMASLSPPLHQTPFPWLGGFNYSFWGWTLFPFLPAPLLISFVAVLLLTEKYIVFETKRVQFLSQKRGL